MILSYTTSHHLRGFPALLYYKYISQLLTPLRRQAQELEVIPWQRPHLQLEMLNCVDFTVKNTFLTLFQELISIVMAMFGPY
jgi:hypothetical protein